LAVFEGERGNEADEDEGEEDLIGEIEGAQLGAARLAPDPLQAEYLSAPYPSPTGPLIVIGRRFVHPISTSFGWRTVS